MFVVVVSVLPIYSIINFLVKENNNVNTDNKTMLLMLSPIELHVCCCYFFTTKLLPNISYIQSVCMSLLYQITTPNKGATMQGVILIKL